MLFDGRKNATSKRDVFALHLARGSLENPPFADRRTTGHGLEPSRLGGRAHRRTWTFKRWARRASLGRRIGAAIQLEAPQRNPPRVDRRSLERMCFLSGTRSRSRRLGGLDKRSRAMCLEGCCAPARFMPRRALPYRTLRGAR